MAIALRRYVSPIYMISGTDPDTGRAFSLAKCACAMAKITHVDAKLLAIDGLVDSWHEWGAQAETCEAALKALRTMITAERGLSPRELRTLPIHSYDYEAVLEAGGVPICADMVTRIYAEFAPDTIREETQSFDGDGRVAEPG
jgi:hypothetical protein